VNPIFHDSRGASLPVGLLEGNAHQLVNQSIGVLVAWSLAIVGTLVLLKITDMLVGLRVREDQELQGLDLSQHGEVGYDFES
jgi:Amt family ammonium transporter